MVLFVIGCRRGAAANYAVVLGLKHVVVAVGASRVVVMVCPPSAVRGNAEHAMGWEWLVEGLGCVENLRKAVEGRGVRVWHCCARWG